MKVMGRVRPCKSYLVTLIRLMVVELVVVMMIKRRSVDLSSSTLLHNISRWSTSTLQVALTSDGNNSPERIRGRVWTPSWEFGPLRYFSKFVELNLDGEDQKANCHKTSPLEHCLDPAVKSRIEII